MNSQQMREERAKLVIEARAIVDHAEKDGQRSLNAEENQKWEKIMADVDTLADKINTYEKVEATKRAEDELNKSYRKSSPVTHSFEREKGNRNQALQSWLLRATGSSVSSSDIENAERCGINLSERNCSISLRREQRAMANGTLNTYDFGQGFDRALRAYGGMLSVAKRIQTESGNPLVIPTIDDTANAGVLVAEAGSIAVTPDPTTGSVTLGAFKYSSRGIQVSLELLQDSLVVDLETTIQELLAERIGRILNTHATVGTGGGSQPNGLFPRASASGVIVGGTVSAPTPSFDNIYDLIASVDPLYRNAPGAGFMMADSNLWRFRKVKDTTGQYLWQPAVVAGQPDRLAGYPVYINQDAPALAANARIVAFGDFSRYYWREVANMNLFRLDELYAMNGQVCFAGLYRGDGNLMNTSAVRTLAAPAS